MDEDAERLGHVAASGLGEYRFQLEEALRDIEERLRDGRPPTADQIHELREGLNMCMQVTENDLAEVADGVEPWERPPDVPYGSAREWYRCGRDES